MNQINAVTLGKLIAAHREGDEQKFKTYVDFIAKAYEEQETTVPLTSSSATIRVTTVSRGRSFWMKQPNRLHTTRQAGMSLMFWGPVAPIAELQKQLPRKKHCNGCKSTQQTMHNVSRYTRKTVEP